MDNRLSKSIDEFIEEVELSVEEAELLYSTFLEELELELKSLYDLFKNKDYNNMKKT